MGTLEDGPGLYVHPTFSLFFVWVKFYVPSARLAVLYETCVPDQREHDATSFVHNLGLPAFHR